MLLPILGLILFQNCGPRHERWDSGDSLASMSDDRDLSIEIFQETLYPLIQGASSCGGCHGQQQIPYHSHPNPAQAHDTNRNLGLVDFESPESSALVVKIRQGHASFPTRLADDLEEAIATWAQLYRDAAAD